VAVHVVFGEELIFRGYMQPGLRARYSAPVAIGSRRELFVDNLLMVLSFTGVSAPHFVVGILILYVFAVQLGWFPSFGRGETVMVGGWETGLLTLSGWQAIILPAFTLASFQMTFVIRMLRTQLMEVGQSEHIRFARARGAKVYTEILGFASSNDAYHPIAPNPEGSGAAIAMRMALEDAGLTPDDIGHIQAHAASTPAGDVAESNAILMVYGERGKEIPVMSVKGAIGHCMGGAGAIESVMAIYSLAGQIIPPTRNFKNPDPEIPLNIVHDKPLRHTFRALAKHGFGLGGQNACLIIGKAPDDLEARGAPTT